MRFGRALATTARCFEGRYGVLPNGNAPFDPQHEFVNKNLLYTALSHRRYRAGREQAADRRSPSRCCGRARSCSMRASARPRPQLDDKVLTAWNGLMIAAFARAARVLGGGALGPGQCSRIRARRIWQRDQGRGLYPRRDVESGDPVACCGGIAADDAAIDGYAEDYAYLIFGLLELFQAGGRSAVAAVGARAAGPAGRAVLGCRSRRLVQHHRRRSVGAACA